MTDAILPYRLSICGLDELPGYARDGVTHVVSILDPDFPDSDAFAGYAPHDRTLMRFDDVIEDSGVYQAPGQAEVSAILALGERLAAEPVQHLLVHCHAGISRSTATAALLMAQRAPDRADHIFDTINAIRPRSWPNSRLVRLGDERLGLDGRLVAAMAAHHARVAQGYPDLAALLSRGVRAHEVPVNLRGG